MPIEFRCTGCQKLLRTQDGTAGKQAKCPVCGTLVLIPGPNVPPPLAGDAPPPLPPGALATSVAPAGAVSPNAVPPHALPPGATPPLAAVPIDVMGLLTTSWQVFYRNMGICIGGALLVVVISFGITQLLAQLGQDPPQAAFRNLPIVLPQGSWWATLVEAFVHSLLFSGQAVFFLKIARGMPAEIVDLFSGWRWALQAFLATLITGLIVMLGIILCVVPGIIAALMLSQTLYFVVDRGAGALEAMDYSRDVTHGNKLYLFLLVVVVAVLGVLAAIPCGLGMIFFLPWTGVLGAVTYLRLTGQRVAGEA